MKLHEVTGKQRWCGPAALSAITGCTTDDAARLIRIESHVRAVKGTSDRQIAIALDTLGYSMLRSGPRAGTSPTLAAWLKDKSRRPDEMFLVAAGQHWQVVLGRRIVCGILKKPTTFRDPRIKRRARVTDAYLITKRPNALPLSKCLPPAPAAKSDSPRRKAKALAKKHGIEIEIERIGDDTTFYYVYPPEEWDEQEDCPTYGNHITHDWEEALERIESVLAWRGL